MIAGFDIICISTSEWEYPWGSRQQIMSRLSSTNRILFVECQFSFLHFLKYPKLIHKAFTSHIKYINNNLIVYRPWFNLPFRYYIKIINRLNQLLLWLQLRHIVKRLKFSKILLWIFEPTACFLIGRLKEKISIYHCIDFFKNEKNISLRRKCIEDLERRLCKSCDIIFVSTNEIFEDKKSLNQNIFLFPSAVNESFLDIDKSSLLQPKDMAAIPRPRIGFIGTLDDRVDFGLIDFIARCQRDLAIVIIGRTVKHKIVRYLRRNTNIYLLGWRDNNLLPAYISAFDVYIIPYKINEFTKGISPIKLFECLALGKPVVATCIPALEDLHINGLIKVAKTKEEFLKYLINYLINNQQEVKKERINFAKNNTWQVRINEISKIINAHISK